MKLAEQTHEVLRLVDFDPTGPAVDHIGPVSSAPDRGDAGAPARSTARCVLAPRLTGSRRRDSRTHRLSSGHWVRVRPLRADDGPALAAAFERLSARSRYRRFHTALPRLTQKMITYLTEIDHHNHEALVAFAPGPGKIVVGVARFIRDPARPDNAEVAVVVADSWQQRGLGMLLLHRLAQRAREERIDSLTGYILTENYPTISLLRALGPRQMEYEGSTATARMNLAVWAVDDPDPDPVSDAVSYRRAPAAVKVVLAPTANRVPILVHATVAAIVEVVTMYWAQAQFARRAFRRLITGKIAPTTHFRRCVTPRAMACTEVDGTGSTDPIVLKEFARPAFCTIRGVPRDRSTSRSDQGRRPPHLPNNRP